MFYSSTNSPKNNKKDADVCTSEAPSDLMDNCPSEMRRRAGRREEDRRATLSKVHISTQKRAGGAVITCWAGGSLISATVGPKPDDGEEKEIGGKRGKVEIFSRASRRRFLYLLSKMRRDASWQFTTLTYPDEFSKDPKVYKAHLRAFLMRLKRRFPTITGFWKLEPQGRGAPHYHLLTSGGVDLAELKEFVPQAWYEVVGSGDPLHLKWHKGELGNGNQHCVQQIRSREGAVWYAGKYIGKVIENLPEETGELWEHIGRYWGVINRENLPFAQEIAVEVTKKEAYKLIRYMRSYMGQVNKKTGKRKKLRPRAYRSLNLMCDADFWRDRMEELVK